MTVRKPRLRRLNPNPVASSSAFSPPPTGIVTVKELAHETLGYWATIRVAWLSGFKLNWVVPGREGAVSGSKSMWNLDIRVRPVEQIFPARTAQYSLEPYVLVSGRPHSEPPLGARVTVQVTLASQVGSGRGVEARSEAPEGLAETARWLPLTDSYVNGVWSPQTPAIAPDDAIAWEASEENTPTIYEEFEYARRGRWISATSMNLQESTYLRLQGMPLYDAGTPLPPITLFFVMAITPPTQYWGSLLKAVEPDGYQTLERTNLDFRLMPDGNLHPFTWGWQYPLPLVGANHTLSLFGFTLDVASNEVRVVTIDRTLRVSEMRLPTPHSDTSAFVLGQTAEAMFDIDVLDVLMYRGPMSTDETIAITNELDAAYGITAQTSQEQG